MSHHLDSPLSRKDPRLNVTDTYAFDGPSSTVLVMIVNTSLAGEGRIPGFHPEARYEFKVHLDGQPDETLSYRFSFGEADRDGAQTFAVHRLTGDEAQNDAANGSLIAEGSTGQAAEGAGADQVHAWAGAAADPFYLDLYQLAFIIKGLQTKTSINTKDWQPNSAKSTFLGSTVFAIVLEIPDTDPLLTAGRTIGVWSVSKLATDAGGWHQTNRAGIPMVWPLLRAMGDADDSPEYHRDSEAHPSDDRANDGGRVSEIVAAASRATGTRDPDAYAALVTGRLLPDVLPYTVGSRASFSFAGFNGRTLGDNAPEVMYSLITNSAFTSGLTSATAANTRTDEFPYVAPSL